MIFLESESPIFPSLPPQNTRTLQRWKTITTCPPQLWDSKIGDLMNSQISSTRQNLIKAPVSFHCWRQVQYSVLIFNVKCYIDTVVPASSYCHASTSKLISVCYWLSGDFVILHVWYTDKWSVCSVPKWWVGWKMCLAPGVSSLPETLGRFLSYRLSSLRGSLEHQSNRNSREIPLICFEIHNRDLNVIFCQNLPRICRFSPFAVCLHWQRL